MRRSDLPGGRPDRHYALEVRHDQADPCLPCRARLLADALARQNPTEVMTAIREGYPIRDLIDLMEKRHPDFKAAMDGKVDEWAEHRKQAGIEKRRTTTQRRRAETT